MIDGIDHALKAGDFILLARLCGITNYKKVFGDASDSRSTDSSDLTNAAERPSASAAKTARLRIRVDCRQC